MSKPYGHFSPGGETYVITSPNTPKPWVNFLTNGRYGALCSQRGGGFSFHLDHRYHSILRRGPQITYEDLPGRFIYIKDLDTGELWTSNVTPFGKFSRFEARHSAGCTEVDSEYSGIASSLRFFVPWTVDAEIWQLSLANRSGRPRRLAVTALAEFVLGNVSLEDHEAAFMALFNDSKTGTRHLEFVKNWWHPHFGWSEENGTWEHRAVFSSVLPFTSALTDREAFFGPFRNHANPQALEGEHLGAGGLTGKPLVGAMQWIVELEPGKDWTNDLSITLIPRDAEPAADPLVVRLQTPGEAAVLLAETRAAWKTLFQRVEIQTPDAELNHAVNHWAKLQTFVTFSHGRGPSYYHKGQYRGMRDACQDTYGFNILSPEMARENILRSGEAFRAAGSSVARCMNSISAIRTRWSRVFIPSVSTGRKFPAHWFRFKVPDRSVLWKC